MTDTKHTHYRGVPLIEIVRQRDELLAAAQFTMDLFDDLTTDQFALGQDKPARDRLRAAIAKVTKGASHD